MLNCKFLVPFEHPLIDPSSEGLPNDSIDYINTVLTWHFPNFPENREADDDFRFAEAEVEDTIQRERLVLGDK
jgi:hypothetical protein